MVDRYCPSCGSDQRGEPIPQKYIDLGYYGAADPYYYRTIAVYDQCADRTTHYRCPDCNHEWKRS